MGRSIAVGLLLLTIGLAPEARAQEPPYSVLTRDVDMTQRLILEREMYHSRNRTARIEARRWQGTSPIRPTWQTSFDPNIGLLYRRQQPTYWYPAATPATFWGGPSAVRIGLR